MSKNWSYLQSIDDIDVGRYFEYDSDALNFFEKWLSFMKTPKIKVLEIGSGSGFFTNILLTLFPNIELTCLEPDNVFVEKLKERFGTKINVIVDEVETMSIERNTYDVVISHIVVHNLNEPVVALKQMKRVAKTNGRVVVIEPLPASRTYYPTKEVTEAFDLLDKAKIYKCIQRAKAMPNTSGINPWNNCYPRFYKEIGLVNISNYGWTSVFTLSDSRYDFDEKKKWLKLRTLLHESKKGRTKKLLLEAGEKEEKIEEAFSEISLYYEILNNASKKELAEIHEQEILHRIIVIGEKID